MQTFSIKNNRDGSFQTPGVSAGVRRCASFAHKRFWHG